MVARAKSINLLLYDGTLQGVVSVEDTSWNSGEMYIAPRDSVEEIFSTDACNKYGVYLLLSNESVYIGQSSDLTRRLTEHINGKDWWESVVILTTKDDSFTHSDIDYLESVLIEKAFSSATLDCDNANKGNPRKVDKFRKVFLGQYLEEALFLMQLIGITVFADKQGGGSHPERSSSQTLTIDTMDTRMRLKFGTRAKGHAIRFLAKQDVNVLLENVDRLLKSPASQRGRDFAIMLSCLSDLGYSVEWRVVNSAKYGFPQRRKRVYVYAELTPKQWDLEDRIQHGVLSTALPIAKPESFSTVEIPGDPYVVTNTFNVGGGSRVRQPGLAGPPLRSVRGHPGLGSF